MKKLYTIFSFLMLSLGAFSQEDMQQQMPEKKKQDIEALKIAFISKELDLTPEEAQKFWPVFNQYSKEINGITVSANDNVLENEERTLAIRKKYKDQFTQLLGQQRTNRLYGAEGRFRQVLINVMKRQKQRQMQHNNRPLNRRNQ